jgi:hypothetical protein
MAFSLKIAYLNIDIVLGTRGTEVVLAATEKQKSPLAGKGNLRHPYLRN